MIVTIPLTEKERVLAESYAKRHGMTLEEAFKSALLKKIEEERRAAETAQKECEQNSKA